MAFGLLLLMRVLNLAVPILYKQLIDSMTAQATSEQEQAGCTRAVRCTLGSGSQGTDTSCAQRTWMELDSGYKSIGLGCGWVSPWVLRGRAPSAVEAGAHCGV